MYNSQQRQKGRHKMNLESIRFPLEGNVQNLVHFSDQYGTYAFTFGSPFCYAEPAELKEKNAFLIGGFNHLKKKSLNAETVYTYYINSIEKKKHPDPKTRAAIRETKIYRGDGMLLGKIDILLQHGLFRSYKGTHANPVFDADGKMVGFCHYCPENKSKDVYLCGPDFAHLSEPLAKTQIDSFLSEGSIKRILTYDIVESEEADNKDRFIAIFSPSKKSELTNNRLRYFGCDGDENTQDLLLTALFAFFWGTYIDIPLS